MTAPVLRCIIADARDTDLALTCTALQATHLATAVGDARNAESLCSHIERAQPDVVLLDVSVAASAPIDAMQTCVDRKSMAVIVTANSDWFAVRAFQLRAVDYLLKPISMTRLCVGLTKARQRIRGRVPNDLSQPFKELAGALSQPTYPERIAAWRGNRLEIVRVDDIEWIETQDGMALIHLTRGSRPLQLAPHLLNGSLDPHHFVRVSDTAIANLQHARQLIKWSPTRTMIVMRSGAHVRADTPRDGPIHLSLNAP